MLKGTISIVITILFIISLVSILNVNSSGIGVAPVTIEINNALRGMEYKKSIFIYNLDKTDQYANLSVGGYIKDWITFFSLNNTNEPISGIKVKGENISQIIAIISIPNNVSNGLYNGFILVEFLGNVSKENYTVGSTVQLVMPIEVKLNVTGTQNINLSISSIRIYNTEVNYPVNIMINCENNGNVRVRPKVNINITKDGIYVDRFTYNKDEIEPDTSYQIKINWNSSGMVAGTYHANITITINGKIFYQKEMPFELFPPGTLSVNGTLDKMYLEMKPTIGRYIKVFAIFSNIGEIQIKAKFICEVYLNGELINVAESNEMLVEKYQSKKLFVYIKPEQNGTYTLKGYVTYSGKTTNIKEITFQIGNKNNPTILVQILIPLVIVPITIIIFLIKKKKVNLFKVLTKKMKNKIKK